jgi:hypothetical protein
MRGIATGKQMATTMATTVMQMPRSQATSKTTTVTMARRQSSIWATSIMTTAVMTIGRSCLIDWVSANTFIGQYLSSLHDVFTFESCEISMWLYLTFPFILRERSSRQELNFASLQGDLIWRQGLKLDNILPLIWMMVSQSHHNFVLISFGKWVKIARITIANFAAHSSEFLVPQMGALSTDHLPAQDVFEWISQIKRVKKSVERDKKPTNFFTLISPTEVKFTFK